MDFTLTPKGPYSLVEQNRYFGGWAQLAENETPIVMAFPMEGWERSAAVVVAQDPAGQIRGTVHASSQEERAWRQALAVLSLDVDGAGYPEAGKRDPVIGSMQREHAFLRPVLFHSPYEAACSFVIGHRLRMVQGQAIRQRLAQTLGDAIDVGGKRYHAFPRPQRLVDTHEIPGLPAEKVARLQGIAQAALRGELDRDALRALPLAEAYARVKTLRGVGDFFATGIVLGGAGVVDALPNDEITLAGVQRFYKLAGPPTMGEFDAIAGAWRPYRMWCSVLVHASERRAREVRSSGPTPAVR
jgi:DNA-3-methyladenine glycosylase II